MELTDYVRIARRRWVSILVVGVVLGIAAAGYWLVQPRQYESSVRLYATSAAGQGTAMLTGVLESQQSTQSFAELVKSRALTKQVIAQTGALISVDDLSREVKTIPSGSTLQVTVTDGDPHRAQTIAKAYGDALVQLVHKLTGSTTSAPPINLAVYDPATYSDVAVSPASPIKSVPLAVIVGLLLGFGAAILRDAPQRRAEDEHALAAAH